MVEYEWKWLLFYIDGGYYDWKLLRWYFMYF